MRCRALSSAVPADAAAREPGSGSRICGNGSRPCRRRLSLSAQRSARHGSQRADSAREPCKAATPHRNSRTSKRSGTLRAIPSHVRRDHPLRGERVKARANDHAAVGSHPPAKRRNPDHRTVLRVKLTASASAAPARHSRARSATTQARATRDRSRPGAIAISQTAYLLQWTRREHPRRRRPGARSGRAMRKRTAQWPRARTSSTPERLA